MLAHHPIRSQLRKNIAGEGVAGRPARHLVDGRAMAHRVPRRSRHAHRRSTRARGRRRRHASGSLDSAQRAKNVEPVAPIAPLCSVMSAFGQRVFIHSTTFSDQPRFCARLIEPPRTATVTGNPASSRRTTSVHACAEPSFERVRCNKCVGSNATAWSAPNPAHELPAPGCWRPVTGFTECRLVVIFRLSSRGRSNSTILSRCSHPTGWFDCGCHLRHRGAARVDEGHAEDRSRLRLEGSSVQLAVAPLAVVYNTVATRDALTIAAHRRGSTCLVSFRNRATGPSSSCSSSRDASWRDFSKQQACRKIMRATEVHEGERSITASRRSADLTPPRVKIAHGEAA